MFCAGMPPIQSSDRDHANDYSQNRRSHKSRRLWLRRRENVAQKRIARPLQKPSRPKEYGLQLKIRGLPKRKLCLAKLWINMWPNRSVARLRLCGRDDSYLAFQCPDMLAFA